MGLPENQRHHVRVSDHEKIINTSLRNKYILQILFFLSLEKLLQIDLVRKTEQNNYYLLKLITFHL